MQKMRRRSSAPYQLSTLMVEHHTSTRCSSNHSKFHPSLRAPNVLRRRRLLANEDLFWSADSSWTTPVVNVATPCGQTAHPGARVLDGESSVRPKLSKHNSYQQRTHLLWLPIKSSRTEISSASSSLVTFVRARSYSISEHNENLLDFSSSTTLLISITNCAMLPSSPLFLVQRYSS